jgi:endonuclease/exonuclease/phosphatase family metal-dependent hydrolase
VSDGPTCHLRVMTWNLWWRFGPHWTDRQHGIRQTLRAVDADLVALQEVWGGAETTQAHELGASLGLHPSLV